MILIIFQFDQDIVTHVPEDVGDIIVKIILKIEQSLEIGGIQFSSCIVEVRKEVGQLIDNCIIGVSCFVNL